MNCRRRKPEIENLSGWRISRLGWRSENGVGGVYKLEAILRADVTNVSGAKSVASNSVEYRTSMSSRMNVMMIGHAPKWVGENDFGRKTPFIWRISINDV